MKYFYYHMRGGQIWPQMSADHPVGRLNKLHSLVGPVIELQPTDLGLTLNQLANRYPLPETEK